jgi:hypothetical protein
LAKDAVTTATINTGHPGTACLPGYSLDTIVAARFAKDANAGVRCATNTSATFGLAKDAVTIAFTFAKDANTDVRFASHTSAASGFTRNTVTIAFTFAKDARADERCASHTSAECGLAKDAVTTAAIINTGHPGTPCLASYSLHPIASAAHSLNCDDVTLRTHSEVGYASDFGAFSSYHRLALKE